MSYDIYSNPNRLQAAAQQPKVQQKEESKSQPDSQAAPDVIRQNGQQSSGYDLSAANITKETTSSLSRLQQRIHQTGSNPAPQFLDVSRIEAEKYLRNNPSIDFLFRTAPEYKDCPVILNNSRLQEDCHRLFVFVISCRDTTCEDTNSYRHIPVVLGIDKNCKTHLLFIAKYESNFPPYSQGALKLVSEFDPDKLIFYSGWSNLTISATSAGGLLQNKFRSEISVLLHRAFSAKLHSDSPHIETAPLNYELLQIAPAEEIPPFDWHEVDSQKKPILRNFTRLESESHLEKTAPSQLVLWQDKDHSEESSSISLFLSYKVKEGYFTHIPLTLDTESPDQNLLVFGRKEANKWIFPRNTSDSLIPPFLMKKDTVLSELGQVAAPYLEKGLQIITGVDLQSAYPFRLIEAIPRKDNPEVEDFTRFFSPDSSFLDREKWLISDHYKQGKSFSEIPPLPETQLWPIKSNTIWRYISNILHMEFCKDKTFVFYLIPGRERTYLRKIQPSITFGLMYKDMSGKIHDQFIVIDYQKSKCFLGDHENKDFLPSVSVLPSIQLDLPDPQKHPRPDFDSAPAYKIADYLIQAGLIHKMAEGIAKFTIDQPFRLHPNHRLPVTASQAGAQTKAPVLALDQ